ncbi:MAG: hypothetical protein LLG44_04015 [Chloroflexi bacterium]|nr:hypothetical protein [Chloroflexota bacterium]
MKSVKTIGILVMLVLAVAVAGCALAAPTAAPPTLYEVGQTAESAGVQIVLQDYAQVDKQVHMNFTITNNTGKEYTVSTRYTMEGQNQEGNKLVFVMCPENELGGRLAEGESMTGTVCMTGFDTLAGLKIMYDPTAQMHYTIAWELK